MRGVKIFRPRIIPCLLLKGDGLVKTIKFKNEKYIGDPINAIRIFNEKKADELIFLDIDATKEKRLPSIDLISKISDECFMPFSVGGGIRKIEQIKDIIKTGAEKVIINSYAVENPDFITHAANYFGSQSIVVSIDVKKSFMGGYNVFTSSGQKNTGIKPVEHARMMEAKGAGEIFLNSIDKDGTMEGYDIKLLKEVSQAVNIPVIACGGAGNVKDFERAVYEAGVSAVSAGSYFVFYGKHRAVLINFPKKEEINNLFIQ